MKINRQINKKKLLISIIIGCILVVGTYLTVASINHFPPFASEEKIYQPGEQVVNLDRSETEKQAEEMIKNNPELKTQNNQTDTPKPPEQDSTGKAAVNVLVTNVGIANGTVSASGMVTNTSEDSGTCTYTFTNGENTLKKTSASLSNPTSTTCSTVRFPASELTPDGKWNVVLTYESSTSSGKSSAKEFTK